jgi:hypothetical protein
MTVASLVLLCAFCFPALTVTAQSYCLSPPQLKDNSNRVYGLVGPASDAFANNTVASVAGILVPYNPSDFVNPTPNYSGTIYVSSLQVNGQTFSYSSNPAQSGQAQVAATSTVTTQGLTMITYVFTTVPTQTVTVLGTIFYTPVPCISPLANQQNTTATGSLNPSFNDIIGILVIIGVIALLIHRQKK